MIANTEIFEDAEKLYNEGFISFKEFKVFRDLQIRKDFLQLKKTHRQLECFFILGEKYLLSPSAINNICYQKNKEVKNGK